LLGSLAKALGWNGNQLRDAVVDGSIVGKTVVARIYHSTGTQGATFANVGEFRDVEGSQQAAFEQPDPAAKPAKKSAARTPAARVAAAAQSGPEDDIPF
jgi:hypothetical protein